MTGAAKSLDFRHLSANNTKTMNYTELYENIRRKGSFLCVGLDTDPAKIPACVRERHRDASMLAFNKAIIDATAPYTVAYKPNIAFYEAEGVSGWQQLSETVRYIRTNYPDILIIADAKRGDIGNTADRYARAFFETMDFDALTLAPYMGSDSIRPFLQRSGRWGIVLAMTSNKSAEEFETLPLADGMPLYERVIRNTVRNVDTEFGDSRERLMFVVGATRPEKLAEIRRYCPDHFLLVPGVGAQGGSLKEVALRPAGQLLPRHHLRLLRRGLRGSRRNCSIRDGRLHESHALTNDLTDKKETAPELQCSLISYTSANRLTNFHRNTRPRPGNGT